MSLGLQAKNIIFVPLKPFDLKPESVNKLLERSFRTNWNRPALSNYRGETLLYSDLARQIAKMHIAFSQNGIEPGDKVAICSRNQAHWAVCFLAALTYGAVPVPLLHDFKPGNIHYLVNHSDAKLLFVERAIWDGLNSEDMPGLTAIIQIEDYQLLHFKGDMKELFRPHLEQWYKKAYPKGLRPDDLNYREDGPEDLAILSYTSGTSGFSKGVMIPYRAVWSNVYFMHENLPMIDNSSRVVSILPTAHMYGMMFEFLFEMVMGCHVYFLNKAPSPKVLSEAFAEIRPNVVYAVPLIVEKIYKNLLRVTSDGEELCRALIDFFGGNFEEVIIGGAPLNPEVERVFRKIKFPFTIGYGMTECAPIISYSRWFKGRMYSCGTVVPNIEIRVDSKAPHLIPGEVQVIGANVFLGYYKNAEATAEAFTPDGWFRTGDVGILDNDGYLFLRGRTKCMILGANGQNIYPEEIEAALNNMPYVVHSLVIEDNGKLIGLIYPDYRQADLDGLSAKKLGDHLMVSLQEVNKLFPNFSRIAHLELMPEDFEMTPKGSIKRYLYQRNRP